MKSNSGGVRNIKIYKLSRARSRLYRSYILRANTNFAVLEKIMVKLNYSQDDMRRELRTRKRILEWMVLNDIRKADQVSQIVTEYYVRPNEILARVDGLR